MLGCSQWEDKLGVPNVINQAIESDNRRNLIKGGKDASPDEYPFMANTNTGNCGISLIGRKHLLGNAHCYPKGGEEASNEPADPKDWNGNGDQLYVCLGSGNFYYEFEDDAEEGEFKCKSAYKYKVVKISFHPGYNFKYQANDLAVLELEKEIPCNDSKIRPISLMGSSMDVDSCAGTYLGIGTMTDETDGKSANQIWPKVLQEGHTKMLSSFSQKCAGLEGVICTKSESAEGVCGGDSGGPVYIDIDTSTDSHQYVVAGIGGVMIEGKCGNAESAFTWFDVSRYRHWIESATNGDVNFVCGKQCDKNWHLEGTNLGSSKATSTERKKESPNASCVVPKPPEGCTCKPVFHKFNKSDLKFNFPIHEKIYTTRAEELEDDDGKYNVHFGPFCSNHYADVDYTWCFVDGECEGKTEVEDGLIGAGGFVAQCVEDDQQWVYDNSKIDKISDLRPILAIQEDDPDRHDKKSGTTANNSFTLPLQLVSMLMVMIYLL